VKLINKLFCVLVLSSCAGSTAEPYRVPAPPSMRMAIQEEFNQKLDRLEEKAAKPDPPKAEPVAIEKGYLPRLIIFTAPEWCVPCQKLDNNILALGQMVYQDELGRQHYWAEKIGSTADHAIQIVDASDPDGDGAKTSDACSISKFPTIVRIDRDGKRESQYTGVIDAETICRYQAGKWAPPRKLSQIVQGGTP